MLYPYAELHCVSNFSFLRGASHPEELVERAHELGYAALAITDECSLAGVVRAHLAARTAKLPLIVGAEFSLRELWPGDGARLVLLACNRNGYGNLSELISTARRRADKGSYRLLPEDLTEGVDDCVALLVPDLGSPGAPDLVDRVTRQAGRLRERFGRRFWVAAALLTRGADALVLEVLRAVSKRSGAPLVAAGDVHFHVRSRKSMQDVLTGIRLRTPVSELGMAIAPNAEQHLRSRLRLGQIYPAALLEETLEVASHCSFSLDELRYEYPEEIVPDGETPTSWLRNLTYRRVPMRYPNGLPDTVRAQIEHELALIAELRYEPYFLTVADLVDFARDNGILCQGRGSAANSAVCYCLGITEVDPSRMSVLFERFISRERNEPPDIDVDFEHQRREEVIQYIYRKYGRERAALTATVASYRPRSALRDVGRALGIDAQRLDQVSKSHQWWDGRRMSGERLSESGFDPGSTQVQHWVEMTNTLMGFPRHLSQHTGGFVIARDKLTRLVPVENAAMDDRTVIQWDKDDLDALGLLKVDVLALGMLSAIRRALEFITERRTGNRAGLGPDGVARPFLIQQIPAEDPATYDMISSGDTVGVFQIESRAQMSMLPRLRPRCFYDLVIEVAIVRPGPIQGGMVHPYLRRRQGLEPVVYPREEIKPALARTLGVPIFQEQVMQIAMLAAGFTPGEADALRRAMAAWRRKGGLREIPRPAHRRHARAWLRARIRRVDLPADPGLRRIRFSGVACGQFRAARLRQQLDQVPRASRLPGRAAEQPTDGLLCAGPTGARCARARHRGARRRRAGERARIDARRRCAEGGGCARGVARRLRRAAHRSRHRHRPSPTARGAARAEPGVRDCRARRPNGSSRRARNGWPSAASAAKLTASPSTASRTWPAARRSTGTACRCWPVPVRCRRWPATAPRPTGRLPR